MLNNPIQNQIDLIIFEEGSFAPLSWLLREGYLDYHDYLSWKNGTSQYLADQLKTPIVTVISALEIAKDYAGLLGLESFRQIYLSTDNQSLHFCRSAQDELIFTTVFEPAQDRIQMDLFFDSADSCAVSSLKSAIVDASCDEIPALLTKLRALNPEKYLQFKQLLDFQQTLTQTDMSSDQKLFLILQKTSPLAFELLGRLSHDFMTPLWHMLSEEMAERSFHAEYPQQHLSFTAFKEFQWQRVISSIEQEKSWRKQPILIFRYAEACFKQNREWHGINHWFSLFIQFPGDAEKLINECCNRLMVSQWQYFCELEPELESTLFPAWMVMKRPAFAYSTVTRNMADNKALQLIEKLVGHAEELINKEAISDRARLQQISPALFVHYMRP